MREIEFRGKWTNNDEWVYGSLLIDETQDCLYIVDKEEGTAKEVESETVGQYTGLRDCKSTKIYTGDIIKGIRRTNLYEEYECFKVHFHKGCYMAGNFNMHEFLDKFSHKEVAGNLIDNPELLERKN